MLPMDQPGVEVRPLRQMNGMSEFNETFLTGACVDDADRLGGVGLGWSVAQTTLAFERSAVPPLGRTVPAGEQLGWLDRPVGEARRFTADRLNRSTMFSRSGRAAIGLARRVDRAEDPISRQEIADLYIRSEIQKLTTQRVRVARIAGGPQILKLQAAELARRARDVDLRLIGARGIAAEGSAFSDVILMSLSAHLVSIGGGTDQVQKNILAERALGLPREPDVSRNMPFSEIARSARRAEGNHD
jgi:alkylation response protein AidB-like acyl-CoA dehydrogenase